MKISRVILVIPFVLALLFPIYSSAEARDVKTDRVLFVLDGSVAMRTSWGNGKTKFEMATYIINSIVDSIYNRNAETEFSLRVFGHQFDLAMNKCNDSRIEVKFTKNNIAQIALRLNDLKPKGKGSSSWAIEQSFKSDITDTAEYRYSFILIQNNGDDCGGDNCTALINNREKENLYRIYKLQLDTVSAITDQYCLDNIFLLKNDNVAKQAIDHIVTQYPRQRKLTSNIKAAVKTVKANQSIPKEKPTVVEKLPIQNIPKPTVDSTANQTINTVEIRKGPHITSREPIKYGFADFLNISAIKQIRILELKDGLEKEIEDIFPVGLDWKMVKLPSGNYKIVYTYGYNAELSRFFDIKPDETFKIIFP